MNIDKLMKYKCIDENGKMDDFFQLLDCFDEILYLELKKMKKFSPEYFCNDINIVYFDGLNQKADLNLNYISLYEKFFIKEEYEIKNKNFYEVINEKLTQGKNVTFQTMFDLVKPYCWYSENAIGNHKEHMSTIIEKDDIYYYVVDSPYVFEPNRAEFYPQNKSISMIKHEDLLEGFNNYCKLMTISINEDFDKESIDIRKIINSVVNIYNEGRITVTEKGIFYCGKSAIDKITEELNNGNYRKLRQFIFDGYWKIHLVYAKHLILKMCIEADKEIDENKKIEIIQNLNISTKKWDELALMTLKYARAEDSVFRSKFLRCMQEISEIEEDLMEKLAKYGD